MAVKFVAGITAWSANAATATSAAFTPATGETLLICGESFVAAAGVITGSQGVFTADVAQANTSGGGANGSNSTGHLLFAKGVSQTVTIASAGGTFEAGFGIRYSGVAAVQKATCTLVAAPGTGANAIVGQPVVVPAGAILVVACIDISNGPTTITSSNANASRFAVTTGNGVFNFFEFNGNGTTITPLCTTTTAADDYFMAQWLLIPAFAPSVVKKPVLFQRPFLLGFKGVVLDATPPAGAATSPISGVSVATTVAVGAMDGSTGTLSGVAVATSDAAGNLLGSGVLSGVSVATSNAVGSLALTGVLAGTSVATTVATGSLTGKGVLSGTSIATSVAAGNLIGSGILSGVSVATSIGIGNLTNFTGGSISGTSVATTYGVGSALASGFLSGVSIVTSVAVGNLIGLGPISGVSVATSNATGNLSGNGFLSGTSVASSAAIGSLTGSGALSGVSVATSYGIGNLLNFNPGAISGVSVATTYGVGDLQGTGGGTQPAGRHRKRYAVVDGWRLLVFDSKKLADEAKAAIQARINPPTKNQRRKLKVRMPTPDLVIDLHHVQASADKIGQTNEFVELQGKRDAQSLLKLHEDIQAQDDEDVALSVAHVLADEDAQHAHLLKVIAMTTLLQRALRKT